MEVRNCKRCNKIFNYLSGPIVCIECKEAEEKSFMRIKEYLYENPKATMQEISTECDISVTLIEKYIREGRLEIASASFSLTCISCGRPITTGSFCNSCAGDLKEGVGKGSGIKYYMHNEPKKGDQKKK
ncbi:MAG: MerR family transcriptional regulator [Oscillospiraceae bacterium]|nr:MerR family transcriptional regulator [Oscillospiraceae bacterium]